MPSPAAKLAWALRSTRPPFTTATVRFIVPLRLVLPHTPSHATEHPAQYASPLLRRDPPPSEFPILEIIDRCTSDGPDPTDAENLHVRVERHHFIRGEQRPRYMLEGHRAAPQQPGLPRLDRMPDRAPPHQVVTEALGREVIHRAPKDLHVRVAPDGGVRPIHALERGQILDHQERLDPIPAHDRNALINRLGIAVPRQLIGTEEEAKAMRTYRMVHQPGHGDIEDDAVELVEPLYRQRRGCHQIQGHRRLPVLEVLQAQGRGVRTRRDEGVAI